jgi:hypothetical protein
MGLIDEEDYQIYIKSHVQGNALYIQAFADSKVDASEDKGYRWQGCGAVAAVCRV